MVAVEPQPALARTLKLLYGRDRAVAIEAGGGRTQPRDRSTSSSISTNPTVSTASDAFIKAADGAPGWEGQHWTKTVRVPVTTLDALIDRHGLPSFIKLDVEGFEVEALAGLTRPVPALSFEFTTIQRDLARAGVERCAALGFRRYNAALGESQALAHAEWQDAHRHRSTGSRRCRWPPIRATSTRSADSRRAAERRTLTGSAQDFRDDVAHSQPRPRGA